MIQLILLLLGADFIRRRWFMLSVIGVIWFALGLFLCVDALDGVLYFPLHYFGVVLLLESLATLALVSTGTGAQKGLRCVKGLLFMVISILILSEHHHSDFALAMLFGLAFTCGGLLQIVSATVVRFPAWRVAVAGGIVQLVIAVVFFQPYPTHYRGTVPFCIALGLMLTGFSLSWLAMRARRLPSEASVYQLLLRNAQRQFPLDAGLQTPIGADPFAKGSAKGGAAASHGDARSSTEGANADAPDDTLTVHVWTPSGSAKTPTLRRPLIDRYIAAVDASGVISTGHAALEAPPDIYISLYPAVEVDRSPDQFARLLRASAENDIAGVYQPDYRTEAAAWCESTAKITFRAFDRQRLAQFWRDYRKVEIYNLTHRNCSSTVSLALEAALEGSIQMNGPGWLMFLRMLVTPELWVAGQIRRRATTMAWTPGLTLDYARALRAIVHPPPISWLASVRLAWRHARRARADARGENAAPFNDSEVSARQ